MPGPVPSHRTAAGASPLWPVPPAGGRATAWRRASRAVAAALVALAALLCAPGGLAGAAEPPEPVFRRGVNLSHWLQYGGRQPVVAADLAALKAAGFDHVRIPFDPAELGWRPDGRALPDGIGRLDDAVALALEAGLAAILDFHPEEALQRVIEREAAAQRAFVALWRGLAERYRDRPAARLAFELLNEPGFYRGGAAAWNALKRRTVAAIRAVDPHRTLLLSSIYADRTLDQLRAVEVLREPRLLYVFHFYDPHLVTHFGATWGSHGRPPYTLIERLLFPAERMVGVPPPVADGPRRAEAVRLLERYVEEGWDAARLDREIALVKAWADERGVRVICTEFGALRTRLDAASRLAWLAGARAALERHAVPWTVWDYADVFGIATATGAIRHFRDGAIAPGDPARPERRLDEAALRALGL